MARAGNLKNLALGGSRKKSHKVPHRSLMCHRLRARVFGDETAESIAGVIERLGRVEAPRHLKEACKELGIGPKWVLAAIKELVDHPGLSLARKVDVVELANWWLMVSTGLYPDRSRVASKRQKRRPQDFQSVRPFATSKAKVVRQVKETGEGVIGQNGRDSGGKFTPGIDGGVDSGDPQVDRRLRKRERYVRERLGVGFMAKVSESDNG